MKIVQINTTCGIGSTGKICVGISQILTENNIENYILYSSKSNGDSIGIKCSSDVYIKIQALKSRLLGNYGFNSKKATRKMIDELERIQPDIVHLHNIHGHDCDLEMLFSYFKEKKIKIIWTFHDCWAFTGYCPHFTMAKCDRWLIGCGKCLLRKRFSWFFDNSTKNYTRKWEAFHGCDLTIVTPSQWLANLVKNSFLKEYDVQVISNGIDLSVFCPTESIFREKFGLQDKKIILGVALGWSQAKGLDVFIRLANEMPDSYQIVMVGTDDKIDSLLPPNVISIHRTQDQHELASIYSSVDVFANPTREEVLGLVNIEALACGTPGVTFKSGGSPECYDETCGSVVECDDVETLRKEITRICTDKPYSKKACIKKAKEFDKNERYKEYLALYERIVTTRT